MGLIHSRASKKRDKAEAALLKEQTKEAKSANRDDLASRHVDEYFEGTRPKWRLTVAELATVHKMEKARD